MTVRWTVRTASGPSRSETSALRCSRGLDRNCRGRCPHRPLRSAPRPPHPSFRLRRKSTFPSRGRLVRSVQIPNYSFLISNYSLLFHNTKNGYLRVTLGSHPLLIKYLIIMGCCSDKRPRISAYADVKQCRPTKNGKGARAGSYPQPKLQHKTGRVHAPEVARNQNFNKR